MSWVWSSLDLVDGALVVLERSSMELAQVHSHHGVEVVADLQGSRAMACRSLEYGVVVTVLLASVAWVLRNAVHG